MCLCVVSEDISAVEVDEGKGCVKINWESHDVDIQEELLNPECLY